MTPALYFPIALWVIRRSAYMLHASYPDKLFEILSDKLRPIIRDNPRSFVRILFTSPLDYDLYVVLGHRFTNLPMYDISAAAIKNGAQVIKCPANIEV